MVQNKEFGIVCVQLQNAESYVKTELRSHQIITVERPGGLWPRQSLLNFGKGEGRG